VPGWHDATRELQREGRVKMVGIVQEQHADRCRLFMQWKQLDWPVMVDSLDLLEVAVVPITVLIDQHGIVRRVARPRESPRRTLQAFIDSTFDPPTGAAPSTEAAAAAARPVLPELERAALAGTPEALRAWASAMVRFGEPADLTRAVAAWQRALELQPSDGHAEFRLGVAHRMLYDSGRGEAADFSRAVARWERALALDPNQYIWRRRIQQYGPRLDKPYPFYDWIGRAREEIVARGETPVSLTVEPRGAELTGPARSFAAVAPGAEPDPEGRIQRDPGTWIDVQATAVPATIPPGGSTRVHLEFRVRAATQAHWNNEAGAMAVWFRPTTGWRVDRPAVEVPLPAAATSEEVRRVEIELQAQADATDGVLRAYALYYVCETAGPCLYRRQDIELPVQVKRGRGR